MTADHPWLVRLTDPSGAVAWLDRDDTWHPGDSDRGTALFAEGVQMEFNLYRRHDYSPSDGYPGYAWAQDLARERGWRFDSNPPPEPPEGATS